MQVREKGNDPSGQMWVYYFGDFRDVAEVLRSNLRLFGSVPRQTLLANLRWELVDNISSMSAKEDGLPRPGYWFVEDVRRDVKLDPRPPIRAIPLSVEQASELVWFVVTGMPGVGRLRTVALGDAIRSREFLFFNQATQHLEPSKPLEVMHQLLGQIDSFESSYKWWWETNLERVVNELRQGIAVRMPMVSELDLLFIFAFYDRLVNIMRLTISLIDFIEDQSREVSVPELIEPSPYGEAESEKVRQESTTHQDVDNWLRFEMTRRNLTRQNRREIEVPEWIETFDQFPALWDLYARKHAVTRQEAEASMKIQRQFYEFQKKLESEGPEAAIQSLRDSIGTDQTEDATDA
jgi:hypothetical protein